jgi:adenylate kinase family enzyme
MGTKFKRIAILGCSGSGKSTLARHLGAILDIEVFHLDTYYWKPNWIEPDPAEFEGVVREIIQRDTWIIEGNYRITRDARLDASDTIIYLNESRWQGMAEYLDGKKDFIERIIETALDKGYGKEIT